MIRIAHRRRHGRRSLRLFFRFLALLMFMLMLAMQMSIRRVPFLAQPKARTTNAYDCSERKSRQRESKSPIQTVMAHENSPRRDFSPDGIHWPQKGTKRHKETKH
jgi:hypothetical protein